MIKNIPLLFTIVFLFIASCNSEKDDTVKEDDGRVPAPEDCLYIKADLSEDLKKLKSTVGRIEVRSYLDPFCVDGDYDENGVNLKDNYVEKIELDSIQVDSLFNLISAYDKYNALKLSENECSYSPRHLIRFFNSKGELMKDIEICFECYKAFSDIRAFRYVCGQQLHYYKGFFKWVGISRGFY